MDIDMFDDIGGKMFNLLLLATALFIFSTAHDLTFHILYF